MACSVRVERIWSRHIVNSAAILDHAPQVGSRTLAPARFAWHCDCRVSS